MRLLFTILISTAFLSVGAQTYPGRGLAYGYAPWQPFMPSFVLGNIDPAQKWQVRPYASAQIGYTFFRGGGVSYVSAPVGIVLLHPLTNNLSAFAGASVSPVVFSMNQLYTAYPGSSRPYSFGGNAAVQAGLIYTNDAKTFSISGSVQVERGSYPANPVYRENTKRQ